jgi:hypothetical protein
MLVLKPEVHPMSASTSGGPIFYDISSNLELVSKQKRRLPGEKPVLYERDMSGWRCTCN